MTNEPQTDNVILKCHYYQTKDKYSNDDINSAHRDFVSCNKCYNYLNYIHTGVMEKVPNDYEQYIGNKEKSCGVFNQDGLLSDEQRLELKHQLQQTKSNIWDLVISFRTNFGNEYCRDYEQAYNFLKKELPKFFKRAELDKDNIIWYAGLHENTENKHIHISFFEKEPLYFSNGGKLKFHSGTIPKEVLLNSKFIFEKALTNPISQILKSRKDLYNKYNGDMDKTQLSNKGKRLLIELYNQLPDNGRLSYASENMDYLRKKVDDITEFFLLQNQMTRTKYLQFKKDCYEFDKWKNDRHFKEENSYIEDMKRRLGNLTINTALEVGKIHDELEKLNIKTANYKAYKKQLRKREWDKIFYLWEQFAYEQQQELDFFKAFHNKLEYYARQQEYENAKSRNRELEL